MYPEFIAIYVGLGILAAMVIAVLVLVILLMVKINALGAGRNGMYGANMNAMKAASGVVFCKKCAKEFDAKERFCPQCGTPR